APGSFSAVPLSRSHEREALSEILAGRLAQLPEGKIDLRELEGGLRLRIVPAQPAPDQLFNVALAATMIPFGDRLPNGVLRGDALRRALIGDPKKPCGFRVKRRRVNETCGHRGCS